MAEHKMQDTGRQAFDESSTNVKRTKVSHRRYNGSVATRNDGCGTIVATARNNGTIVLLLRRCYYYSLQ